MAAKFLAILMALCHPETMQHRIDRIAAYATAHFVHEPAAWQAIRARGEALRLGVQMSAYEGALLHWLLTVHGAVRVLELGCFMGLTALWMARALPADGRLVTIERDAAYAAAAREHLRQDARITLIEDDATVWLASPDAALAAPFDALFIDAQKKDYADYLEAALPHLRPGALVIADNTLLFGAMLGESTARVSKEAQAGMARFHALLADTERFHTTLLPTAEGLTLAIRR